MISKEGKILDVSINASKLNTEDTVAVRDLEW